MAHAWRAWQDEIKVVTLNRVKGKFMCSINYGYSPFANARLTRVKGINRKRFQEDIGLVPSLPDI